MQPRPSGSGGIMGPPSRPDPLNLLRQRSQSYHAKPAPSQPNPGSPYPGYPPPQQLRTLNAALPSSSQSLQSQESQLFTLPKSIQPPNRAVSQASMREGAGWQGLRKVDSYRPSTPAPIPKSAVDVYVQDSQPVVPKGDRILTAVEKLSEDTLAIRESQEDLREDNKNLRDQLHELKMGQKALATTEEVREEVTAQLSPALHEFFASLRDKIDVSLAPLPEQVSHLSAQKVKMVVVQLREEDQMKKAKQDAMQEPLTGLLNHLISLLDPVADIADNLASLQDLPRALSDVAIFKGAIEGLMDKMQALPPAPPPQIEIESVNSLKAKVSELRQSMESQGSFQSGKEEIARVLKGMEGIERDVKDLRTGLRNPITPKSDPDMVKLLDVANTMKTTLDRIATKLDTPSTPTRMECDMMGVERHLAYLKEKTAELKDSLNQIRTRFESAAEDQRPNTPSSDETVTRFPVRGLALRHSEESSQPPRTVPFAQKMSRFAAQMDPVSPPSPDDTHSKGPAASSTRRPDPQIQSRFAMIMDPVSPPSDVFGPKAYISGVFKVGSSEGSPNDPFALLGDDSLSNAPSQADPPSSYTMPSQAKRDHSAGSGSTSTSNSQRRSKRVKINSESQPSSIKTRSQVKKVSNTPEEPIIVDDDSPPKAKDASASKDTKQEIIEESLKSLEPTQTNTQTACQPSQHPLTQRHPVRRPEHLELLAMEKNLTPSSGYRRPVTYGSVDKGRNGKRRALTLEEIADEGVVAEL